MYFIFFIKGEKVRSEEEGDLKQAPLSAEPQHGAQSHISEI